MAFIYPTRTGESRIFSPTDIPDCASSRFGAESGMASMPFWKSKSLSEMSPREWERLCDGCALCCLMKIQDRQTGAVRYLPEACPLLNLRTGRCRKYATRFRHQPRCARLSPQTLKKHRTWLPPTCAYRLLAEGKPLPAWHPLRTGRKQSPREAGLSAQDRVRIALPLSPPATQARTAHKPKGPSRINS